VCDHTYAYGDEVLVGDNKEEDLCVRMNVLQTRECMCCRHDSFAVPLARRA